MARKPPAPISMLRGHEGVVTALHFTDEESSGITANPSLISASDVGEIIIWNLKICRSYHRFKGHNGKMILSICISESYILSQGRDDFINLWKFMNSQWQIANTIKAPIFGFCAAELFSYNDSTYLVASSGEGLGLTFYSCEPTGVCYDYQYKLPSKRSNETCMCIKVVQNEDSLFYLLMGFEGGYVSLWSYKLQNELSRLKCHSDVIFCMDYDEKHRNRGISGSSDNVLQVWKIENNKLEKVHQVTITNPGINAVKIRADGKIVITAGQDSFIRVFSWKNLKPLAVLQFHNMPVRVLEFCKNSSLFASGSKDKNICLWSIY